MQEVYISFFARASVMDPQQMPADILSSLPRKRSGNPSALLSAFRCIGALVIREMSTRYGSRPGGYIWALLQPLGIIIILGLAWAAIARTPALGTSYMLFKGSGFLVLQGFTGIGGTVGGALTFSKALLSFPRVSWADAILARFLLNALVISTVATVILFGIVLFEGLRLSPDWTKIILSMVLGLLLGFGIGCLNCFLFKRFSAWQGVWSIMTAPLILISGVVFLYEDVPQYAQQILWYNPILHVTGMMRDGLYIGYSPQYISLTYVFAWILIPMLIGLLLLRQYHRDLLER
jgi:capsular polysaccharide transport system permease protein